MSRLRIGRSYWLDTFKGTAPRLPSLHGDRQADIAIVGAGVTGCAAALLVLLAGAAIEIFRYGTSDEDAAARLQAHVRAEFAEMTSHVEGLAHGLATQLLFAKSTARAQCEVVDGALRLPPGPGLGVEIDDDALASLRI